MNTVYVVFGVDWGEFELKGEILKVFEDRVEAYDYYKDEVEPHFMYAFIQKVQVDRKKGSRYHAWIQKNT